MNLQFFGYSFSLGMPEIVYLATIAIIVVSYLAFLVKARKSVNNPKSNNERQNKKPDKVDDKLLERLDGIENFMHDYSWANKLQPDKVKKREHNRVPKKQGSTKRTQPNQ